MSERRHRAAPPTEPDSPVSAPQAPGNVQFQRGGLGRIALNSLAAAVILSVSVSLLTGVPSVLQSDSIGLNSTILSVLGAFIGGLYLSIILQEARSNPLRLVNSPLYTLLLSLFLGSILTFSLLYVIQGGRFLSFFLWTLYVSFFHIMEFVMTAVYHPETLSSDSFLLNHSKAFHAAMAAAIIEYWLEYFFVPSWLKGSRWIVFAGVAVCTFGQIFRTGAMWQAGHNFTHLVSTVKNPKHQLVNSGFYSISRHPSYMGWFWWSIGTQFILVNPLCIVAYTYASWNFFQDRIPYEEIWLIEFFGNDYLEYRQKVGVGIPFIK